MSKPPRVLTARVNNRRRFTVFGVGDGSVEVDYVSASDSSQARQIVAEFHEDYYKLTAVFRGYLKPLWHDVGRLPKPVPLAGLTEESMLDIFLN